VLCKRQSAGEQESITKCNYIRPSQSCSWCT